MPSEDCSSQPDYLVGSPNNGTILSWTGTNGNQTVNETQNYLFNSGIESLRHKGLKNNSTRFLLPFGFCSVAEGAPAELVDDGQHKHSVYFKEHGEYFVSISDPKATLQYYLPMPLMTGDRIKVEVGPEETKKHYFSVHMKEKIVNTADGSCAMYPGHDNFESYSDCVDAENRKRILPIIGCMVPWMSDKDQCKDPILRLQTHKSFINWLEVVYRNSKTGFFINLLVALYPALYCLHMPNIYAQKMMIKTSLISILKNV